MADDPEDAAPDRSSTTRFSQGEVWDEAARDAEAARARADTGSGPRSGSETSSRGGGARTAAAAAAAMVGATVLALAFGAPAWLGVSLGLAAFVGLVAAGRRVRRGDDASAPPRRVAESAGPARARLQAEIDAADAHLTEMTKVLLQAEVAAGPRRAAEAGAEAARRLLDELARDPGDATAARKFLVVVIPSARAAAEKFAAAPARGDDMNARFEALMRDFEAAADDRLARAQRDDQLDLEVEMDVLAERLKR